jgi:UDP-2,3-diacylglucosamine hydrolase
VSTLLISDLHLDPRYPDTIQNFINLLESNVLKTDTLYILGDLFEIWIGDDYIEPAYQPVIHSLQTLTQHGTPVFLLHGNRDFLLGNNFMQQTGCTLLPDPVLVDLYGQSTLLMHGDLLCTDDAEYQAFRHTVRDPEWQTNVLRKSIEERLAMAEDARSLSSELTRDKPDAIMDVNDDAVRQVFEQHDTRLLIHGHTHRPGFHELMVNNKPARRIVLGDWHQRGNYLVVTPDGFTVKYC